MPPAESEWPPPLKYFSEKEEKEESSSTFADNLDPEMAAKLASLFSNN